MADRAALPDWPRLMSIELAAAYYSLSVNTFRSLGIAPIEQGRRVVYDRRSLDLYADRLAGAPLDGVDQRRASTDVERDFLARRNRD